MEPIRKFFSASAAFVGGLIGTGLGGVFFAFSLFSLPLNVIAIMRIKGWDWWQALIATVLLGIIPFFGQVAYVILAFVGAYFIFEAKFDWREAIEPTPQTITFAQMTPEQFASYKLGIPARFAKRCKQDFAEMNKLDGKLLAGQSAFCECYGQLAYELLTQDDLVYEENTGSMPSETTSKIKAAVTTRCN